MRRSIAAVGRRAATSGCGIGAVRNCPTEPQFRALEAETQCNNNKILRDTLTASFLAARKAGVPFADLIAQQILAAKAEDNKPKTR